MCRDIYQIHSFTTYTINIDFNNPILSNNKIIEIVNEIEKECPIAKSFGVSGIGEGVVFDIWYKGDKFSFKMKGEKHAGKSKVKKANKVDDEKLQLIYDIVDKVTPNWRLSQIYSEVFDIMNGGQGDIKRTGDYLKAINQDIIKEELDMIIDSGLEMKDVNKYVSQKARKWLMIILDKEAGL